MQRPLVWLGVLSILFGLGTLVYNVIPIHHQEQVAKIGSVTANEDKEDDVVVPPIASIAALVVGGALIFTGRRV